MTTKAMFKVIGIGTEGYDAGESMLLCPTCREQSLHHRSVEVFSRAEDDIKTMVAVTKSDGTTLVGCVDSDKCLNPSNRRDGLRIHFTCEHCFGGKVLEIAQHKGHTLVSWRI